MIALPYDYFLIAWFVLAAGSTAYVAFDQFNGNPEPTVMKWGFIFWDQETVRAMTSRIEATTGIGWVEALCAIREFSEYMLYGYFVQNDPSFSDRHKLSLGTQCVSYWDDPKLGKAELNQLLRGADKEDVALSVASFSGTPVQTIRAVIEENRIAHLPDLRSVRG